MRISDWSSDVCSSDLPFDRSRLEDAVARADVLVPTLTDEIDAALIGKAGPQLKLIANFGNGVDHLDLKAARAHGIVATNTPGVLTDDTADMTKIGRATCRERVGQDV